ncbi:transposase IS166 family protein [Paraburkholderia bryophila]|uniref:Transposase IS166 family protein n=1 Tax=Paraburkholderia bryophila TaxID=420952 RepID=A0A329CEA5_9BURK|nr:transposase IS166 family protein [Paraburkholderia bryophila]
MTRANPLPDDVETLKAMLLSQEAALRERDAQVLKLQETVDSQQAALASRAAEVEHLKLLIAKLRRMQFGRKSEKLDRQIEQLELRLEELETTKARHRSKSRRRSARSWNRHRASCPNICRARSRRTCPNPSGSARSVVA